jgi:hypothetical protein
MSNDTEFTGNGKITLKDGSIYEGDLIGKPHGKVYEGKWENGEFMEGIK